MSATSTLPDWILNCVPTHPTYAAAVHCGLSSLLVYTCSQKWKMLLWWPLWRWWGKQRDISTKWRVKPATWSPVCDSDHIHLWWLGFFLTQYHRSMLAGVSESTAILLLVQTAPLSLSLSLPFILHLGLGHWLSERAAIDIKPGHCLLFLLVSMRPGFTATPAVGLPRYNAGLFIIHVGENVLQPTWKQDFKLDAAKGDLLESSRHKWSSWTEAAAS